MPPLTPAQLLEFAWLSRPSLTPASRVLTFVSRGQRRGGSKYLWDTRLDDGARENTAWVQRRSTFHMTWSRGPIARKKKSLVQVGLGLSRYRSLIRVHAPAAAAYGVPPQDLVGFVSYCARTHIKVQALRPVYIV